MHAEDELLVSFDVVSLFTNVPIGEAVEVIQEMLRDDEDLIIMHLHDLDTIPDWGVVPEIHLLQLQL